MGINMLTDYKFKKLKVFNNKTECIVRFYEGDITTEDERNKDDLSKMVPVTRYRRTKLLREETFNFPTELTEQAIKGLMNSELAKDNKRQAINEQRR